MPSLECSNPLVWPKGQPRTEKPIRSQFADPSVPKALKKLDHELTLMGALSMRISADLPIGRSGQYLTAWNRHDDHGVVVSWTLKSGATYTLANDNFDNPSDNLWGIALSIEAMRGLKRWGGDRLVEMAFSGAKSLPQHGSSSGPFDDLNTKKEIDARYYELAKTYHSDHGGTDEMMAELNSKRQQRLLEINGGS